MRRGEALLLEHLDDLQREQYRDYGCFIVRGRSGRRYVIDVLHYSTVNVWRLNRRGEPVCAYCYTPRVALPTCDIALAQKLSIQDNDRKFRRRASKFGSIWVSGRARECASRYSENPHAQVERWLGGALMKGWI